MNKLIEKLCKEFETACHLSFDCVEEEKFKQAIQTACKAQRNACMRAYVSANFDFDAYEDILTAKIEREDYE